MSTTFQEAIKINLLSASAARQVWGRTGEVSGPQAGSHIDLVSVQTYHLNSLAQCLAEKSLDKTEILI